MRGQGKRKDTYFQHGHKLMTRRSKKDSPKKHTGPCAEQTPAEASAMPGGLRRLRPRPEKTSNTARQSLSRGNRVINVEKMVDMWNSAILLHDEHYQRLKCDVSEQDSGHSGSESELCTFPQFDIAQEVKWGLGWKQSLQCTKCQFTSPTYKLYSEVSTPRKRGAKPAAVNLSLQSGLMDTPIGNRGARLLMTNMDIPPPAKSSMQRLSNFVSDKTTLINTEDMKDRVQEIKDLNKRSGNTYPNVISVAVDARYNTTSIGHSKKAGQGASQAIALACETVTDKKYIISAVMQNKLCWIGAWMRGKGLNVQCPGGHEGCTGNLLPAKPLSEYDMGQAIGSQLAMQDVLVKYATTDGDARSAKGIEASLKVLQPMWEVERLADPYHLAKSQFRQCNSAVFSTDMFQGKTKLQKTEMKKIFSQDVKARCSLVMKELMKTNCGDLLILKKSLPKVLQATVKCYAGDCSMCRRHSLVCGGGPSNCWWFRSMYLGPNQVTSLEMNENDKFILTEVLKIRLSEEAVTLTRFNTNTQKCEAVNRSISVSLPKNVNYGRNAMGRLSSVVLRNNMGIKKSTELKAESLGAPLSARTQQSLKQMQNEYTYHKTYRQRPEVIKRTLLSRGQQIYEHSRYKRTRSGQSGYRKGQLDPHLPCHLVQMDHTYSE